MVEAERTGAVVQRWLLVALVPLVAAAVQWLLWPVVQPFVWFFFYPAVFLVSRIGGLRGGLVGTAWSMALATVLFVEPRLALLGKPARFAYPAIVFAAMGVVFSVTHERLRRANRTATQALAVADAANRDLAAAHAEVSRLLDKTRELDRAKTSFFANVSHELRTPLTLILGPLARHLADTNLPGDLRRDLDRAHRNALLLLRHVNEILEVSKLGSGRLVVRYRSADLAECVARVVSLFEGLAAERGVRLSLAAPPHVPATLDDEMIERVLVNLLGNAFKFTPDGGQITLTLSVDGQTARLHVDDSGPGVPDDQRAIVFEPFRQAEGRDTRRAHGTGLGLAIVRDLITLHGGAVGVGTSDLGGARFEISLPLVAPPGALVRAMSGSGPSDLLGGQAVLDLRTDRAPGASDSAGPAGAPHLLVAEDNAEMLGFLCETFAPRYRVTTARDGREALARAVELHPDLVVSDVMMPEMSGEQLLEELRANPAFDDVPVILLTAKADAPSRLHALERGVQEYLGKPFSTDELLARVDGLLRTRAQARSALHAVSSKLELHVAHSPVGVIEFTRDFRVIRWSGQAERIFGWTAEEAVGKRVEELHLLHEDDEAEVRGLWASFAAGAVRSNRHTNRNRRKDGTALTCDWYNSVVLDARGELESVLSLALDITARVEAERELEVLYAQAKAEVAANARLLMEVNHRVKNNLLSLSGMLLVEQRVAADAGQTIGPEAFERFARRVGALLAAHELLTQIQWSAPQVTTLAREVIERALASAGAPAHTRLTVAATPHVVSPRQAGALAMVLNELATNSAKHARDDGPTSVTVEVHAARDGRALAITYRDDGPGYPEETLRAERLGVGLRLIREIVEGTLRGSLTLSNDRGAVADLVIESEEPQRS